MLQDSQTLTCPECGAPRVDGLDCWAQFCWLLAWEWDDPELLAEHFLTVASYNLQHPAQFTEVALTKLKQAYIDFLDKGIPIKEVRQRVGRATEGKTRVLKP